MIWSGALMLEFLGKETADSRYQAAHDDILQAIEAVIASGATTPDMGGSRSTQAVGQAIVEALNAA
jgi:tartrate dehydrogenase/decarboxylase/D-malate dehydrogenase